MLDRLIRPGRDVNLRRPTVLGLCSHVSGVPKNASWFERQCGRFSRRCGNANVFESARKLTLSEICSGYRHVDLIRNEIREIAKSEASRFASAYSRRFRRSSRDRCLGDWMRLMSHLVIFTIATRNTHIQPFLLLLLLYTNDGVVMLS